MCIRDSINIQLGQGADVDFEFALLRQRIGKLIVETVDSFNDKDILLSQLQVISLIFSLTAYKIVSWKLYPPVSYTHLDVYKRQDMVRSGRVLRASVKSIALLTK